jgi:polysaccharide export outer membrane protein
VSVLSDPARLPIPVSLSALAGACLLLGACADRRGGSIPYDVQLSAPDAPKLATLESDYRIAPADQLSIKVLSSDEMTGDYQVDLAGHISMPLVGEVAAAGLTTAQLDEKVTELLGQKYFENPDVSIGIKESALRTVTVDGAVKEAGAFPVAAPLSLMQAVALAKGISEDANSRRVAVFRTIQGQRQAAAFDLTAIRRGESRDPQIYPGDIVIVDGSGIKQAYKRFVQSVPLLGLFRPF